MDDTDIFTEIHYLWTDTWHELLWDLRAMLTGSGGPAYVKAAHRQRVMERDHYICQICHKPGKTHHGPDKQPWHIDHILAYSHGGPTTIDNLRLACATCNRRKAAL